MEMVDGLAGVIAAVKDRSEARSCNAQLTSNVLHRLEKVLKYPRVLSSHIQEIIDMLLRNNQHMNGQLGADVFKGEYALVFKYVLAW